MKPVRTRVNNEPRRVSTSPSSSLPPSSSSSGAVRHRKRSSPFSPPTSIELRGVNIHFPFKPYKCQEDYMGKVLDALHQKKNALLESPTGTGKTLCLLCATLAWQREQANAINTAEEFTSSQRSQQSSGLALSQSSTTTNTKFRRTPTIIYASRTHSQLSQVVRELRNTRYRPKHAVLGSREQMCVNPKVKNPKKSSTASEINHDCNKLGKERKCRFRNKLEGFQPPPVESGSYGTQPVMDMEDLVTMGHTHQVCPFYYTRSMVENAELILVPYNYLFDNDARKTALSDIPWDNSVVIFDEAHNLESFASDSASFDLSNADIAGCVRELDRAMGYKQAFQVGSVKEDNILRLKAMMLNLEDWIMQLGNTTAHHGEFMMEVFRRGASITYANHHMFIQEVEKVMDIFMEVTGGNNTRGAPKLEHFVQCVKRVYGEATEARCLAKAKSYRVYVSPKGNGYGGNRNNTNNNGRDGDGFNNNNGQSRTVSYWCFAPAEAMRDLAALKVRSILVTSGTLSPMESYALELGLPFPHRLENPHIIEDDQIHVRVVSKGVTGKILSSSYERRQDADYYLELGNTLVSLSKVVPGGMLVFFPSYGVMEACMERWGGPVSSTYRPPVEGGKPSHSFFAARRPKAGNGSSRYSFPFCPSSRDAATPWKRLLNSKALVVEPKSTADLPDAIAEFHKYLGLPKSSGCLLFGVCRGKISEGIDFAHDMCRAVVITGLPFAPSFDPKVKMKREFLDGAIRAQNVKATGDGGFGGEDKTTPSLLSGHEWYTQQAHRAVNQAIGRVIRNKDDYGSVLLLDSRFSMPRNQQGLSMWVRPHIQNDEGMGRTIGSLVKFYRNAKQKEVERAREKSAPPPLKPSNGVSVILGYEDEGEEDQLLAEADKITKLAYIKDLKAQGGSASEGNPSGESSERREADNSPTRSYIPPDRIVARLDVSSLEPSQELASAVAPASKSSQVAKNSDSELDSGTHNDRLSWDELPKSAKNQKRMETTADSQQEEGRAIISSQPRSKKQQPAVAFFQLIQTRLSSSELSELKKGILSLHRLGQKNDKKTYVASALEVVRILLPHESFENRNLENKHELLGLLFPLLPELFRQRVQRKAMAEILHRSKLGELCRATLELGEYNWIRSEASSLLLDLWYKGDSKKLMRETEYMRRSETFLKIFLKQGKSSRAILDSFCKLIPVEYLQLTRNWIDQLKSSAMIERMKASDKSRVVGEDSVQTELFRRPQMKSLAHGPVVKGNEGSSELTQNADGQLAARRDTASSQSSNVSNPYATSTKNVKSSTTASNDSSVRASSTHAGSYERNDSAGIHARKRTNPYARAPVAKIAHNGPDPSRSDGGRAAKLSRNGPLQSLLQQTKPTKAPKPENTFRSLLRQTESDMYVGKAGVSLASQIKCNAPQGLTCPICSKGVKTPFLSECGHMACIECWLGWFKKSQTCPVCRKPATSNTLARAVFQPEDG